MTKFDYDVLYIGSGHGTFDGAIPLSGRGVKVAVVEEELIGGTCPNWGCNAKIILDSPVALKRHLEDVHGIVEGDVKINWPANMTNKHRIIDGLPEFIQGLMDSTNVDVLFGHASLISEHEVKIGDEIKTADKIVISTGLRPHRIAIPGSQLAYDSKEFLNLEQMPKQIAIIGGGYIAFEFATIANESGAQVNLLMHGNQGLRQFPQDYVQRVIQDLEDHGVIIQTNVKIKSLEQNGDKISVVTDTKTIESDWVLDATGRIPNTDNIGLDEVGVKYTDKGITVNEYLQTNIPNIYASGDVIDKTQPKLTPTAIFESMYLMHKFAGDSDKAIDYPAIPTVVFTSPRIAQIGVTLDEAKNNPDEYIIENHDVNDDWFRQINNPKILQTSMIFNKNHQLVGAVDMSDDAVEIINALVPAIEFKYTPEQIQRLVHLFPSIGFSAYGML